MRTASLLIHPDTPATFRELMSLLTQLIRMNPSFTEQHQGALDKTLAEASAVDDFQLTFGTLLPICRKLLDAKKDAESGIRQ